MEIQERGSYFKFGKFNHSYINEGLKKEVNTQILIFIMHDVLHNGNEK